MNVLHVIHYARGGIVTVVCTQIQKRKAAEIEYHLAVLEESEDLRALARDKGIRLHVLGTSVVHLYANFSRLLAEVRPDIIHTHSYVPRMLAALMVMIKARKALHISTLHNDYPYFYKTDMRSRFKRYTEAVGLKLSCRRLICGSQKVFEAASSRYAMPGSRLRKIHNGIDLPEVANEAVKERATVGPLVLTVGRVSEQKNYGLLIDCWKSVLRDVPTACLWIVGDGEQRISLQEQSRSLGVDHSIRFVGWQTPAEVAALFAQADVFVLSSLHESLPTAMLEAFGAGLPVVTTRVAGAEEVIEHGLSGFVVNDRDELVAALTQILRLSSAERRAMGQRGRDRVLAEFTAERFVGQVEALYVDVAA